MTIRHVVSVSGGKDSTATLLIALERFGRERVTPILMTALATGLALVPLALGGDLPGQEIEHPMAVVILGGLITSTMLTLIVVPVVYTYLDDLKQFTFRLFRRRH